MITTFGHVREIVAIVVLHGIVRMEIIVDVFEKRMHTQQFANLLDSPAVQEAIHICVEPAVQFVCYCSIPWLK
jgi:hypothetical protein